MEYKKQFSEDTEKLLNSYDTNDAESKEATLERLRHFLEGVNGPAGSVESS